MKKHFLLIALFTLMFLGLGNYSYVEAGSVCNANNNQRAPTNKRADGHYYSCETPSSTQDCIGVTDCGGGKQCCINKAAPTLQEDSAPIPNTNTPPPPVAGAACTIGDLSGDTNAIISYGGLGCDCAPGFKNVNKKCKSCSEKGVCCGIQLNTSVPFIGNCIEDGSSAPGPGETSVTGESAFPTLMGSLTKILVTVILIVSFVLIIVGGIMIATGNPSGGKKMIMKVVVGIALLGASGVILRLINPNFFG